MNLAFDNADLEEVDDIVAHDLDDLNGPEEIPDMDDVDILLADLADLADLDDEEPAGLILYNRKELDEFDDGYDDLNDLDDG